MRPLRSATLLMVASLALPATARGVPDAVPDLPVLGQQALRGAGLATSFAGNLPVTPKVVDGDISDWTGEISRFGGTAITSRGEYVYQDYVMDDWGADDGQDAARVPITDELNATEPRTYRTEALAQALGEQFGAGCGETVCAVARYGDSEPLADGSLRNQADIEEVRVAADAESVFVLVRTTGMTTARTGLLLLVGAGGNDCAAPGGVTTDASYAILANAGAASVTNCLGAGSSPSATVVTNSSGFTNAIELSFPRSILSGGTLRLAAATGVTDPAGGFLRTRQGDAKSDLINVAFRFDEPVRIWNDHNQALALRAGTIDQYAVTIDLDELREGYTESFQPRPGYYERVYESDSLVSYEGESGQYYQGPFQHYGLYLPTTYRPGHPLPATWWTHYRGGHAHDAAAWVPGLIRQLGEQRGNIVITPGARGTSSWYVGRGHEDFLDVWDDSMASFPIDPSRVYMSGYSMGGFASWLLPMLYPDRFAGSFPTAGPPTQGLWVGAGDASSPQNNAYDANSELTFNIIENARNVPYVIYHGTDDELVPYPGVARMAARFAELGYRHRLYTFPGYEHYTAAIIDEWTEAAAYLNQFRRDPNPARVTYRVWPALETAVETVNTNAALDYSFDGAYWVDGLRAREVKTLASGKPDPASRGTIDAVTYGRGVDDNLLIPEAGSAGQGTPYAMTGTRWLRNGTIAAANRFEATLTNLSVAELDLSRMGLATTTVLRGTVTTDGPADLVLIGNWSRSPTVGDCLEDYDLIACKVNTLTSSYDGSALTIHLNGAATYNLLIRP